MLRGAAGGPCVWESAVNNLSCAAVRRLGACLAILASVFALASPSFAATKAQPAPTLPPAPTTTVAVPTLDEVAASLLARGDKAVSVAVWKNGQMIVSKAWGTQTKGVKATVFSRFQLASMSKFLATVAAERLVTAGKLDLDMNVAPKLAALGIRVNSAWNAVTLRQLLSHTSGAPVADPLFFGSAPASSCKAVAMSVLASRPLRTPGTHYAYSNVNFCLVGLVLQSVTGSNFEALIDFLVWGPVGVSGPHVAKTGKLVKGDVAHPVTPGRRYLEPLGAAGSWVATPSDIVKVVASLSAAERASMLVSPAPTKGTYGLGTRLLGDGTWGHTGTLEASRGCFWVEPDGTIWSVMVAGRSPVDGAALRAKFLPTIRVLATA
jgi:D-alanyl-D-alanine carboxypeptidase